MANEFKIKNGAIVSGSITGVTEPSSENSAKMASTSWVRTYVESAGLGAAGIRTTQSFIATANQTTFTVSGGYSASLVDVFVNGSYLNSTSYTASNGTTVVLTEAAAVGDIVDIVVYTALFQGFIANTDQITEGSTNLYYTNARARAAISLTTTGTSGAATYNNATGVLNIPQYQGGVTSFNTRTGAITLSSSDVTTALTYTPVPSTRTLTINGTALDLSADRSWTITSMIYPGAGIAVSTGTAWGTSITNNSANWNTAFGWGNHALAGYATTTAVNTAIANLIDSAPATLDTLNELAAALGDDPNFATTIATSIGTKQNQLNGTGFVKASGTTISYDNTTYQPLLTNPVTGTGTVNDIAKFTAAGVIGDSNIIDTGTLITLGSNTNISSGGLGIGNTSLTGINIRISSNLIGGAISSPGVAISVHNASTIQSDVNVAYWAFNSQPTTATAAFTLSTVTHYQARFIVLGSGSAVTNQYGFFAANELTQAVNNYGFYGDIASGTNRWNLYMNGTANNYVAGAFGIGRTSLPNMSLGIDRNITGGTVAYGVFNGGTIQSDVTSTGIYYTTSASTAATTFTLNNLVHYSVVQSTFGAGSTVTTQTGFLVNASLVGATNNWGFRGAIPLGANRFNLYMDGTASNYLEGDTSIGTTTLGTATKLTVGGSETALSAIARGQLLNTTLVASANNDVLVGLDIAPTFTNGAFTGVTQIALRLNNAIQLTGTPTSTSDVNAVYNNSSASTICFIAGATPTSNSTTGSFIIMRGNTYSAIANQRGTVYIGAGSITTPSATEGAVRIYGGSNVEYVRQFANGNWLFQNGGTFTDTASARVAINSTTQGFLPPRMTAAQMAAIASPAPGLIVYQTDGTEGLYIRTSTTWRALTMV